MLGAECLSQTDFMKLSSSMYLQREVDQRPEKGPNRTQRKRNRLLQLNKTHLQEVWGCRVCGSTEGWSTTHVHRHDKTNKSLFVVLQCLQGNIWGLTGEGGRLNCWKSTTFIGEEVVTVKKGLPGVWKIHSTLQVTLCCAHNTCCKHRDKPWFSWHPAAAEHGQNEQKQNKCMVKTERQSMMQQRRMINTKQSEISNERQPVQLSVHTHITPTDKM